MRWKSWIFLFVIVVMTAGIFAFYVRTVFPRKIPTIASATNTTLVAGLKQDQPLVTFLDPVRGNAKGSVLVVEYGDYICPFCRSTESDIKTLLTAHPEIKFVWKDLPNSHYPGSDLMAEAAQCAKSQGKFWEYRDRLFEEQSAVSDTQLSLIASDLGLDVQSFSKCLTSHEMKPLVDRSISEAIALDIDATPYFFINGKRYSGQLTYDQLQTAVKK